MNEVDAAALETFLSAHADSSLILRSNIRAVGLGWSARAYEAQYLAAWDGELVTGLVGHAWNGNVLLQAPREAAALALAVITHSRRAVAGLIGPWEQVEEVRSALGLRPEAFRLREKENLMSVALGDVRGDGTGVRIATAADLDTLTSWRASYEREALFNPSPDVAALRASLVRSLPEGTWFVLEAERALCAMGVFTARLPDSVQLGSIYTPPALRSRGYARRLVAGMIRASGAARAVLFTKDAAAMRAYRAVGFRDCGSFGLALLGRAGWPGPERPMWHDAVSVSPSRRLSSMTSPKRWARRLSNVIGFDDAPHVRGSAGRVGLIGCVCSGPRLDIVMRDTIEKDGDDATDVMQRLASDVDLSHVRGVMLQGITFAGFNVIDIHRLSTELDMPVLVATRRKPRLELVFKAVMAVPDWQAKRALMEAAGEPEACGGVYVQRAGLTHAEAERMLERTTQHGIIPEPLRLAHLIAGGTTTGKSRGRT